MLLTTTDSIEGQSISKYLGLVTGEAVFSTSVFGNLKAGLADLVGGRVESYEKSLETVKNNAMVEMIKEGEILGAHAVVGIDIDYFEFMSKYFMVVMSGTAVQFKDFKPLQMPDSYVMPMDKREK